MGQYKSAVITNGGLAMIAQATSGGGTITFTAVKTSSYSYPADTNIPGLTDLQNIVQSVSPSAAEIFNNTMIQISARFDNSQVTEAYQIQTIGVYAQLSGESEQLFAVIQATTPDQMPKQDSVSPTAFIYNIQITVQQASQINITVNPAGAASIDDVNTLADKVRKVLFATLTASGWTGSSAPYSQTATVEGITADMQPILVSNLQDGADLTTQQAYTKAFSIVAAGTAETGAGTVTFKAYKKPATDIIVGLKGVE